MLRSPQRTSSLRRPGLIIKRLTLGPFAAATDRTIEPGPELTIILGPNESGKSTLFRALTHILLTSVDLTPAAFDRVIGSCLPRSGGDTIRVTLDFESDSHRYELQRTWVKGNKKGSSLLRSTEGGEFTNAGDVDRELEALLPASSASVREVLLTGQSALTASAESLLQPDAVRNELGMVLRRAVMDSGGISVDAFRSLLERRHREFFDNWDIVRNAPAGGRGIDNPHRRSVGRILGAFYAMSEIERDLSAAKGLEQEIDSLNAEIRSLEARISGSEEELNRLSQLRESVRLRESVENELRVVQVEIVELQKLAREWPTAEERLRTLTVSSERSAVELASLDRELEAARTAERNRKLKERFSLLAKLKAEVDRGSADSHALLPVKREDVQLLRSLDRRIDAARAVLAASSLSVRIRSSADADIALGGPSGETEQVKLTAGAEAERTVDGIVTIEIPGFSISVASGSGNVEESVARMSDAERQRTELLSQAGAANAEELEARLDAATRAEAERAVTERRYTEALGSDSYESLEREAASSEPVAVRPIETIAVERAQADRTVREAQQEISRLGAQIASWQQSYGSYNSLLSEAGRKTNRHEELTREASSAPPLPDGFASADEFFARIDRLSAELRRLQAELTALLQERTRKEARLPEESSVELEQRLLQARADYTRTTSAGQALDRVKSRSTGILAQSEADTFSGYQTRFMYYLSELTGGRYTTASMSESTPSTFGRADGTDLPPALLSAGTRDSVALALRLVMAEYLLGDTKGFLVLDDPLVDMDPERRELAARTLASFARRYQTILLTCHPEHAATIAAGADNARTIELQR